MARNIVKVDKVRGHEISVGQHIRKGASIVAITKFGVYLEYPEPLGEEMICG